MKYKYLFLIPIVFISCMHDSEHWSKLVTNEHIGLDDYWRKITGYDTLQITSNYSGDKLEYNFCYPNSLKDKHYDNTECRWPINKELYIVSTSSITTIRNGHTNCLNYPDCILDSVEINGYQIKIKKVK